MNGAMTESPDKTPRPRNTSAKPARERKAGRKAAISHEERPRVNGPRAIADLMPDIGRAAFRKFGFIQSSIVTRWVEIVGQRYGGLTMPNSIRFPVGKRSGGTLQLTVAPGHAPMVQHITPEIIERVNRFFGYDAVTRVSMRQGEVRPAQQVDRPPPAMLRPVPVELGQGLREVSDPELRAVLESLAQGLANAAPASKIS